jgi:hypothetical protein
MAAWLHVPVLELVREFARCHAVDPRTLGPSGLVRLALEGGPHEFARAVYHTTHDFAGILDGAVEVVFLDAYADTVRSFAP